MWNINLLIYSIKKITDLQLSLKNIFGKSFQRSWIYGPENLKNEELFTQVIVIKI